MDDSSKKPQQGHWVLAKMGKKVLRPGGRELTIRMLEALDIGAQDDVVEFAPGLGFSAALTLKRNPRSYTGVELDERAAVKLRQEIKGQGRKIVAGNASSTGLPSESYDKAYGEAMLTMQSDPQKSKIIGEAFRLLRPGGLYGIHELGLTPDSLDPAKKEEIRRALVESIRVNARPMTVQEWSELLRQEGFELLKVETSPMLLLEKRRIVDDEGLFRSLKIAFNILTHPKEREQILKMRKVFRRYHSELNAVSLVVQKQPI